MIKVRNETGESPCYICDFVCSTKQKLAHHTITEHHGADSLICMYCQFKFKDVSSVRRHIKTVHMHLKEYMCSYCNKKYKHKYDLEKHFTKIHKSESREGQNFCSECQTMCFGWEQLKKHYLDAHGKTIQHIKCPQCMKIFFDVSYLKQHFRRVHNNTTLNVVYCQTCGAVFEEHVDLIQHMEDKHCWNGESAVFCAEERCHELFEDMEELDRHRAVFHKGQRDVSDSDSYKKEMCLCPECQEGFFSKIELVGHLTETHKWRSVMECQKCSKLFSTSSEVQEHLNSHFLEPSDAPLLPTGKHSILKKRLLKRKNIKDLSQDLEPKFFIRVDQMKNGGTSHEVVIETNNELVETPRSNAHTPERASSSKRRLLTGPPEDSSPHPRHSVGDIGQHGHVAHHGEEHQVIGPDKRRTMSIPREGLPGSPHSPLKHPQPHLPPPTHSNKSSFSPEREAEYTYIAEREEAPRKRGVGFRFQYI